MKLDTRVGRWMFGLALAGAWLALSVNVFEPVARGVEMSAWCAWLPRLASPLPWAALSIMFAAALWRLMRSPSAVDGAAVLALLVLGAAVEAARLGSFGEHHAKHLPAAALLGWLGGWLAARNRAPSARHVLAADAACGVIGAVYVLSAFAKLSSGGTAWFAGGNLGLLLAERAADAPSWLAAFRLHIALTPLACTLLAVGSVTIESAGILMLFPPLRRTFAIAALSMHAGIALLMGYVYVPWMLILLGTVFTSSQQRR